MKHKFTTFDIRALVTELQHLIGLRVVNVYDADSKTFLIKLNKPDVKCVLLLESGIRLHTTEFEWPKNILPSSFAMKMRKHLKGRRLEKLSQLGCDRIIDLQFGSSEAAYHVILEMYDRGNIVLTDFEYTILNIQRPRTDNSSDVKFIVREKYPIESAKTTSVLHTIEELSEILKTAQDGDSLKKILNPHLAVGGHLIEHCLMEVGLSPNSKLGKDFDADAVSIKVFQAIKDAENIMNNLSLSNIKGYIIQEKENKNSILSQDEKDYLLIYSEFHPMLFHQNKNKPILEFDSFDKAIDEFYSKIESQKQDRKLFQHEKTALKKLEHIKSEHLKRIEGLEEEQAIDERRATLIEVNLDMVDEAILIVRSALASKLDWREIERLLEEASKEKDNQIASSIKSLNLATNHIMMLLKIPEEAEKDFDLKPMKISIDLGLSAYANACKFYGMKRQAAVKQNKTIDVSEKAFKSAEKKTMQALKEVHAVATIIKARKTHWFEKFLWFISSENYIVVGGRDQQQNEIIVKKYLKAGDIYVHADLHGASSVVIKNPTKTTVPPVTLNEAGTMALCYSAAWEARVVTQSWWVYHDQVSKTAPTGEYLTTGSFMIRGKKNYLPPSYLIYGFAFLFKLDDSCLEKHKNERRPRLMNEDADSILASPEETTIDLILDEEDVVLDENDDDDDNDAVNDHGIANQSTDDEKLDITVSTSNNLSRSSTDVISILSITEINEGNKIDANENNCNDKVPNDNTQAKDNFKKADQEIHDSLSEIEKDCENMNSNESEFPETNIQFLNLGIGSVSVDSNAVKSTTKLSVKERKDIKKLKRLDTSDHKKHSITANNNSASTFPAQNDPSSDVLILQKNKSDLADIDTDPAKDNAGTVDSTSSTKIIKSGSSAAKKKSRDAAVEAKTVAEANGNTAAVLKRGQRSKLKKIKEKYADQDEEERELKMQLLASGGESKVKKQKGSKQSKPVQPKVKPRPVRVELLDVGAEGFVDGSLEASDGKVVVEANLDAVDDKDDEADGNLNIQDVDTLDSLTGTPLPDDLLLYCVPVCAPYSVLLNYKYKVKLAPGTTKRGKAAKMALNMFMHERSTTQLEKDLLRSVKDTDLSRNIPGKVKVSTTKAMVTKQRNK